MKSRNILCIDSEDNCHLYDLLFANINKSFRVVSAENMTEALDFVKSRTIDLYILERLQPEVDGIELCRLIRQTDSKTPIVFYSGMSRPIDRSLALAAGANAYFVKAAEFDKFLETVAEFLN